MKWVVTKDGKVYFSSTVPIPPDMVKAMKQNGYKVKEQKK